MQRRAPIYDKAQEGHYNLISALHKCVRGSDPDAALYYFARMLDAGEDPLFLARRIVADGERGHRPRRPAGAGRSPTPRRTPTIFSAAPRANSRIAEAVVYLATAPKSNARLQGVQGARRRWPKTAGSLTPPKTILNAPTRLMKNEGYGADYEYDHDAPDAFSGQNYWPDAIGRRTLYEPVERGLRARGEETARLLGAAQARARAGMNGDAPDALPAPRRRKNLAIVTPDARLVLGRRIMRRFARAALLSLFCAVTGAGAAAQTAVKPRFTGVVAMGDIGFHKQFNGIPDNATTMALIQAHPGVFSGIDINAAWARLQPAPGLFDTSSIDQALTLVRAYNAVNPTTPLTVKLRVWGGVTAPAWVKELEGAPIPVEFEGAIVTVGRFWDQLYREEWRVLQRELAAQYDSDPLVVEISNSSCSSITSEPFIYPTDPISQANMRAAGYTDEEQFACLSDSKEDYAAWKATRVELPLNPFQRLDSGSDVFDLQSTRDIMNRWRAWLGERGVFSNYGLQRPPRLNLILVYQHMRTLGQPYELQAYGPYEPNWTAAMQYAVDLGAGVMEVFTMTGSETVLTDCTTQQFRQWTTALQANAR